MAFTVAGIGELLWDYLPDGKKAGGAPANFSYHAQVLGARSFTVSSIGNDDDGRELLSLFKEKGLSGEYLVVNQAYPTGSVYVTVDREGIPEYTISENTAWDFISLSHKHLSLAERLDAVCFGTLAQRSDVSRTSIINFLTHVKNDAIKIFDVNFRKNFFSREIIEKSLQIATVLKINEDELISLSSILGADCFSERFVSQLLLEYKLDIVGVTRGAKGSILYSIDDVFEHQGYTVDVSDTIGAGDAFAAAMAIAMLNKNNLKQISCLANRISAFVCMNKGATPEYKLTEISELLEMN